MAFIKTLFHILLNLYLNTIVFFILTANVIHSSSAYRMNIEKANSEYDSSIIVSVYIENVGEELILTSYQCAFTINPSIEPSLLSLTYQEGSSEISNLPDLYYGIENDDGQTELVFVSRAGNDVISTSTLIGSFTLQATTDISNIDFEWNFNGSFCTIITGQNFVDITDPSSHENNPVLPVELTTFSASVVNRNVELNWETETEINNYGFNVERKIVIKDNSRNWEKIGFVNGFGNSNSPKEYTFIDSSNSLNGKYLYRLNQIDVDGTSEYSKVVEIKILAAPKFELLQNYPNPFNPTTKISYSIPKDGHVSLYIYDLLGNEIAKLEDDFKYAGDHSITFDASQLSTGRYFYSIRTQDFVKTKKMLLMK